MTCTEVSAQGEGGGAEQNCFVPYLGFVYLQQSTKAGEQVWMKLLFFSRDCNCDSIKDQIMRTEILIMRYKAII